ncbi:MAG TPA: CAP domain-containing protein [Anaerolineales bacterium]|nr:CAP domain-containing protein [Anaerolineales bacterium]
MLRLVLGIGGLLILLMFVSTSISYAAPEAKPALAGSPLDLVNAVNGLRVAYGLPPYSINPILMSTAQAQADFLAVTGSMTHAGPGGIGFTDRLLAAGYPLAGDLSLGGFRAENITGGPEDMPAEAAVNRWTGDTLHLTTMISPDLTEIGAGVATHKGRVYYVIDAARPTTSGAPQAAPGSPGSGTPVTVSSPPGIVYPVSMSTPTVEGDVIHEVQPGQSLWLIAIAYETKIDEIKSLNSLFDNDIFPGQKLLIKRGILVTAVLFTATPAQSASATATSLSTPTLTHQSVTRTASPMLTTGAPADNTAVMQVAIRIIALAVLCGGIFAWLGTRKPAKRTE